MNPEIQSLIQQADQAIREERFDDLMEFYTEDAVLVINGEKEAHGKKAIKEAFIQIAAYFQNSLVPTQGKMRMTEAGTRSWSCRKRFWTRTIRRNLRTAWSAVRPMSIAASVENGSAPLTTPMGPPYWTTDEPHSKKGEAAVDTVVSPSLRSVALAL